MEITWVAAVTTIPDVEYYISFENEPSIEEIISKVREMENVTEDKIIDIQIFGLEVLR